jgi:hypothetical protein
MGSHHEKRISAVKKVLLLKEGTAGPTTRPRRKRKCRHSEMSTRNVTDRRSNCAVRARGLDQPMEAELQGADGNMCSPLRAIPDETTLTKILNVASPILRRTNCVPPLAISAPDFRPEDYFRCQPFT